MFYSNFQFNTTAVGSNFDTRNYELVDKSMKDAELEQLQTPEINLGFSEGASNNYFTAS